MGGLSKLDKLDSMKKYLLQIVFLFISTISFAQDRNTRAYNTGYAFGKILFWIILGGVFIWFIIKNLRKK